jgi:hypothetical protein
MCQLKEGKGQPDYWEGALFLCVDLKSRGFKRMAGTSRMSREAHVRICEGCAVRRTKSGDLR